MMKRSFAFYSFFFLLLLTVLSVPASVGQASGSLDLQKPVLDRLELISVAPMPEWRFHADLPHPEDPTLDDSSWEVVKVGEKWTTGSRVLRRVIEIPEALNGYSLRGASVKLDLNFDSDSSLVISVFSSGSLVFHGDDLTEQPIPLTQNALPGQKFVVAVRLGGPPTAMKISRSRLGVEPPATRTSPNLLREEILVAGA